LAKVKKPDQNKSIVGMAINELKQALDEKVYTGVTRQIVTRHELLHGIVLALRAYLLGEMKRFLIPTVDKPNGGRPKKITFKLYGRHAGRTDCWKEAKQISDSYEILKK
ncbi:MAG: hypothetical protein NZO16_06490, partial [Deltaproteobacteria bacterium]|nr:hypothetical protein [Deltaproteobacteria bacterium]